MGAAQIRLLILFLVLGSGAYVILSKPYKSNYRFYKDPAACELYLPKEAVDINYFKSGNDWEGYDFSCDESSYRQWIEKAEHVSGLEIKEGGTFVSYYSKSQDEVDQLELKNALKAVGIVGEKQVYFIFDPATSKAYYFSHAK